MEKIRPSSFILPAHLLLTLYYINFHDKGSRYTIGNYLGISISKARKILTLLEEDSIITSYQGRKGSNLTKKGNEYCNEFFNLFKIINPLESINLEKIVLGEINCLVAFPRIANLRPFNPIEIRDSAMKIGALGASIFRSYYDKQTKWNISFTEINDFDTIQTSMEINIAFSKLIEVVAPLLDNSREWIIIASTIKEGSKINFNPYLDKKVTLFQIALLSAVQSCWELINR